MAYNEQLAARVRQYLFETGDPEAVDELRMMGGLCFMYKGKMLAGILREELMCRVDPARVPEYLEEAGCRLMSLGGRSMNGYLLIDETAHTNPKAFRYWIRQALDFNDRAKASRKRN